MLKVIKVRIYPNKIQTNLIHQHFGSCRKVYNLLLDAKINAYECGDNLSAYDLKKRLVPMKNSADGKYLKEVDSTSLQNSILNMDKAYKNFFKRVKKGKAPGFPKFKSKHNSRQSYQSSTSSIKNNKLYLPRIGEIKTKFHRGAIEGKIKTVTVSSEANQYFASINYEDGLKEVNGSNNGKTIALDMGITIFATSSENKKIHPKREHILNKDIQKMKKAQKNLSRKKKGSKNRKKAKLKLAKKHLKIKNKRNDFLHKVTKKLSENQTIVVEKLEIKSMTQGRSANTSLKTRKENKNRTLHNLILKQSWGKFFDILEYKLKRNNGNLIRIDPKYTSQRCSCCGHTSKKNRRSQSQFICVECEMELNADYNAALNILAVGNTVQAS